MLKRGAISKRGGIDSMEDADHCETIVAAMEISRDDEAEMVEEVIFDANEVANEVSITASVERSATISIPTSSGASRSSRKPKQSVTPNKAKNIQSTQASILVTNQPTGLAQFITSIRPPVLPGTNAKVKPVVTNTKVTTVKKPLAIAPAPSPVSNTGVIVNKVIMTTPTGQPLLISSPVKCADQKPGTSNTNVQNQQIVLLSPMKPSTPQKLVQVRPKPATTATTIPMQSNSTLQKSDLKQIQIIRLVSVPNSANNTTTIQTSGTKTVTINKLPSMTTITSNANRTLSTVNTLGGQKILMTTSSLKGAHAATGASTAVVQSSQIPSAFLANSGGSPVIMVPAQFLQSQGHSVSNVQNKGNTEINTANLKHVTFSTAQTIASIPQRTSFVPIAPSPNTAQAVLQPSQILAGLSGVKTAQNGGKSDGDSNRPRKPCNCTKSQCLKLYCDCFANGEFCHACNCVNCANNLDHEEDRQKAIKQCLERNPHAFHPKIGKGRGDITERRHTKGCNCRRSGCLKNYCECYEAKILCSDLCKCIQCKNYEDSYERKTLMHLADAAEVRSAQQSVASKAKLWGNDFTAKLPIRVTDKGDRLPCSFITPEVLEATCQCLLATAEDYERMKVNYDKIEEKILEEFGSCLNKIIETANKARKY